MPEDEDAMRYDIARSELVGFVPASARRLLDVGCSNGRYAEELALHRPDIELWGVEPDPVTAAVARPHFHTLVEGAFPDAAAELPQAAFDVVTFNDVLEHLLEPEDAIRAVEPLLTKGGRVVASIPNVRHRAVIWPLLWRGRWDYEDTGLLDRTHLRFFTRDTMVEMFERVGWRVETVCGVNARWHWSEGEERRRLRLLRSATRGRLDPFLFVQYVVSATPR